MKERDLHAYQEEYLAQPYEHIQKRARKRHLLTWMDTLAEKPARILEVGCGDDSLFNLIDEFERFTVIEPADVFYDQAAKDAKEHTFQDRIDLHHCTLEGFQVEKEFDVIIVSCLLHEIQDQKAFLSAVGSLMGAGTRLYLDVPNAQSFHRLLAVELGFIQSVFEKSESQKRFQQNDFFSVDSLRTLMEATGFSIQEIGTMIFKPFTHGQMQGLIDKGMFTEEFMLGMSHMSKYMPEYGSEIFVVATR